MEYKDLSPEETVRQYCRAMLKPDYNKMYHLSQYTWQFQHSKKELKNILHTKIQAFQIVRVKDHEDTPLMKDVFVKIKTKWGINEVRFRIIKEKYGTPHATSESGFWGVNPISVMANIYTRNI